MSAITQIKSNAEWVRENFGPESGLADFGYNSKSVAYLDAVIGQIAEARPDAQTLAKYVSLLGAFLGEALLACHGGRWVETDEFPVLQIERGEVVHVIQPFGKVQKRIVNGEADSLVFFIGAFVPGILAGNAAPEWNAAEYPASRNKPWWKVW